jgi:alginate O-acetyltransferase complex protein AlgI
MVFSSLLFLFFFFPLFLGVYFACPDRGRNAVLLLASLVFYAWGEPIYIVLMLFSTGLDYTLGRLVARDRGRPRARLWLALSVAVNLSLLGVFKYAGWAVSTFNTLTGLALAAPQLALPLGISFYTFQTMSYSLDIYRGDAQPQKSLLDFACYVAMFPQLIAGPIVRYQEVAGQLTCRKATWVGFGAGMERLLVGLMKKVLLANSIGTVWDSLLAAGQWSALSAWLGLAAFGFQIYFDFSGYSDMAIGLGQMMGFTLPENFRYPYLSRSIGEFWRRWHMTLSTWFREYVYIPLGGNRRGKLRTTFNLAVVWALTGLWHGASWNFVLWGMWFGLLIILERLLWGKWLQRHPVLGHVYTLLCVFVGWAPFAVESLPQTGQYLLSLVGGGLGWADRLGLYQLRGNLPLLCILALAATPWPARWLARLRQRRWGGALAVALTLLGLLATVACLVDATYNPFLYFRF